MSDTKPLTRWAALFSRLTTAAIIILPIVVIYGAVLARDGAGPYGALALSVGLITPVILLWTLNEMRKLFAAYARGAVFTDASARLIQRVGQGFLALAITPLFVQPVQSLLLSLGNPPGQRSISITIESDMILFALSGGLIIVIGWAMRSATAIAAENRAFV